MTSEMHEKETETVTVVEQQPMAVVATKQEHMELIDVQQQMEIVKTMMTDLMMQDKHYGIIPGCGKKPTLLKPGAELLLFRFRLYAEYQIERIDMPNGHREYDVTCSLRHIGDDQKVGEGVATCTTMESKYRYRNGERKCPSCGKASIIKGKAEYGGGWLCFKKKDGCGAKFNDDDARILGQQVGRIENEDLADSYNTVKKIGKKRALVDAALSATAASEYFTQDIEEMFDNNISTVDINAAPVVIEEPAPPAPAPKPAPEPEAIEPEPVPEPEPTSEPEPQQPVEAVSAPVQGDKKVSEYGNEEPLPIHKSEEICRRFAQIPLKGGGKAELTQGELEAIMRAPVTEWLGRHGKHLNRLFAACKAGAKMDEVKGLRYGRDFKDDRL